MHARIVHCTALTACSRKSGVAECQRNVAAKGLPDGVHHTNEVTLASAPGFEINLPLLATAACAPDSNSNEAEPCSVREDRITAGCLQARQGCEVLVCSATECRVGAPAYIARYQLRLPRCSRRGRNVPTSLAPPLSPPALTSTLCTRSSLMPSSFFLSSPASRPLQSRAPQLQRALQV